MNFLLNSLRRAIKDEEIHMKQENHTRYRNLDATYGQSDDFDIRKVLGQQRELKNL